MPSSTHSTFIRSLAVAGLSLGVVLGVASAALAAPIAPVDVKLKSGATWKGDAGTRVKVTYTINGKEYSAEGVFLKSTAAGIEIEVEENGRKTRRPISIWDLKKLETVSVGAAPAGSPGSTTPTAPGKSGDSAASGEATKASSAKIPSIFVLPWEGTVGIGARHDEIEMIAKEADKLGDGQIIVLQVNSPGGLVIEGDRINELLTELKKRHRVIAWIKKAISAAAFTSLHCDEIYFMRVGALGSITMFSGQTAISGKELDAWLKKLGEVCELGGRPAVVGQAMVTNPILCSYDRDEDGNITWYNTLEGKYDLSDEKENLTLNAENALHCKFSDGTADTVQELAALLQLKEWKEASDVGRRIHENWQRTLKECAEVKPKLLNDYGNPAGLEAEDRMANQIRAIKEILKWYDKCYPGMVYEGQGLPPDKKPLQEELERLQKELGRMKKNR
jgi:hypothetical protein